MDPYYHSFGNSIRSRLADIWSSRSDSISYCRHGVNRDNKGCVEAYSMTDKKKGEFVGHTVKQGWDVSEKKEIKK